jgi:hypothetical protein
VPGSVIATIYLLKERSVDKIVARLTTKELELVIKIAGRSPQIYPPGAYAALEGERDRRSMQRLAARSPDARISPGAARMRKTRERRRKDLRLLTIEVPLNPLAVGGTHPGASAEQRNRQKECVQMPGKIARSDPRLSVRVTRGAGRGHTSRLSCKRAGKTRISMPV